MLIPREGPELDRAAERMFGLTRAPGESDLELRIRVMRALADPVQNARAYLRALRTRRMRREAIESLVRSGSSVEEAVGIAHGEYFGAVVDSAVPVIEQMERLIEEGTMAGIEMRAPDNPYRRIERERALGEEFVGMAAPRVGGRARNHEGPTGPGLSAQDIDGIARQHFLDGCAATEREYEPKLEAAEGRLADAFDEGFVAGRIERARGLARDYHVRMMEPLISMVALHSVIVVKASTKKAIAEAFNRHETAMRELERFAEAMMDDPRKSLVDDPHVETG